MASRLDALLRGSQDERSGPITRRLGFRSVLRKNRYGYPDLESGIASELRRLVQGENGTNRLPFFLEAAHVRKSVVNQRALCP